jgi:mRNA-degrading endonuclease HigB of HigAB toxin-antitoxin module
MYWLNVISKPGLLKLLVGKSADVKTDALNWYHTAKAAEWTCFNDVGLEVPDADFVEQLLVFNIRQNRFRPIVLPVFSRRTLYVKALLDHKTYERKEWVNKWP